MKKSCRFPTFSVRLCVGILRKVVPRRDFTEPPFGPGKAAWGGAEPLPFRLPMGDSIHSKKRKHKKAVPCRAVPFSWRSYSKVCKIHWIHADINIAIYWEGSKLKDVESDCFDCISLLRHGRSSLFGRKELVIKLRGWHRVVSFRNSCAVLGWSSETSGTCSQEQQKPSPATLYSAFP